MAAHRHAIFPGPVVSAEPQSWCNYRKSQYFLIHARLRSTTFFTTPEPPFSHPPHRHLEGRFPGDRCDYLEAIDGDADCSSDEIAHYSSLIFRRAPTFTLIKEVGPSDVGHIGSYLCDRYTSNGGSFREYGSLIEFIAGADYFQ